MGSFGLCDMACQKKRDNCGKKRHPKNNWNEKWVDVCKEQTGENSQENLEKVIGDISPVKYYMFYKVYTEFKKWLMDQRKRSSTESGV